MLGAPGPGDVKTAATALHGGGRKLLGLETAFHRFWVSFGGSVERERRRLPWKRISTWRVDPGFHGLVMDLVNGAPGARNRMRERLDIAAQDLYAAQDRELATDLMLDYAVRAAAVAVEDQKHPAALALQ